MKTDLRREESLLDNQMKEDEVGGSYSTHCGR
jgi:hypothetical protein